MKIKIIKGVIALFVIISAIVVAWSFFTKITSTPILVKTNESFLKIDEKGKVTELSHISNKEFIQGIGFYKDSFIYTSRPSENLPTTSIWSLNTKTHELTELTKGLGKTFFSPMLKGNKLVFETEEPFSIWVLDLDNGSKVNVAEGLESPKSGSGTQFGEYIISKDSNWIIFTAFDPMLKKDCYFSARLDGSKQVNLTGNVPISLTAIDTVNGKIFTELTVFSEDGTKLFFNFSYNGKEISYLTSIDGSFKTILPYGYFVSFVNNDYEIILLYPNPTTGNRSILKVSVDGKTQNDLTKDLQGDCYEVKFYPKNNKIIFTFAPTGSQEYSLWIMDVDGSNKQKIANEKEGITHPMPYGFIIIPNSNKIVYQMQDPHLRKWSLWAYDMDDNTKTKLLGDSDTDYTFMYLSSNGKYIIVASGETVLLTSTNGNKYEVLNGFFGSNTFSILNYYLIYESLQDQSLYLLDVSNGT
ncbi:MAG: hypothetical protein K6343_05470, partial [Caldisericaceae bacterium]